MEKKILFCLLRRWKNRILAKPYTTVDSAKIDYIDSLIELEGKTNGKK